MRKLTKYIHLKVAKPVICAHFMIACSKNENLHYLCEGEQNVNIIPVIFICTKYGKYANFKYNYILFILYETVPS